jgi:mRNA-degrading endonuclease RelE of RelBE toxin-antitoxin system
MEYSLITVAETESFRRKVSQLLSGNEKDELIVYLSMHPNAGVLIKGTGGIRKLRWARSGRGKSGGVRVIYYFHSQEMPLYLLTLFGKNEKANITKEEKNILSMMVRKLVNYWSQRQ